MEDGKVDVVFYPQLEKSPLEAFTQEQQEDLLAGKAILADVKDADGRSSKAFVQIDTETNQDVGTYACHRAQLGGAEG